MKWRTTPQNWSSMRGWDHSGDPYGPPYAPPNHSGITPSPRMGGCPSVANDSTLVCAAVGNVALPVR